MLWLLQATAEVPPLVSGSKAAAGSGPAACTLSYPGTMVEGGCMLWSSVPPSPRCWFAPIPNPCSSDELEFFCKSAIDICLVIWKIRTFSLKIIYMFFY